MRRPDALAEQRRAGGGWNVPRPSGLRGELRRAEFGVVTASARCHLGCEVRGLLIARMLYLLCAYNGERTGALGVYYL